MIRIINRSASDLGKCGIEEKGDDGRDDLRKEVKISLLRGKNGGKGGHGYLSPF